MKSCSVAIISDGLRGQVSSLYTLEVPLAENRLEDRNRSVSKTRNYTPRGRQTEMIRDGETGRLVAPNDPHQLAGVLKDLLENRTEREHIAANQLQLFHERYCAEAAVDRLMEIQ